MKTFTNVQPKAFNRKGIKTQPVNYDGTFNADVTPGVSIRIYGEFTNRTKGAVQFDKTFKPGDRVEHGSWNLIYTGEIVSIGPNSVTVERTDIGNKPCRMDLYAFVSRNWDFSAERVEKHNNEESKYI